MEEIMLFLRPFKLFIFIAFLFVFLMPRTYSAPFSGNMGATEFVSAYNSLIDYLVQQQNGNNVTNSFQDAKINFFTKRTEKNTYAGMLSNGIATYFVEDDYGKLRGVMLSYSITPISKENASSEALKKGSIIGTSIALSMIIMGVPYDEMGRHIASDNSEIFNTLYKSWHDRSKRYSMTLYSPTVRRNIIFASEYDNSKGRYIAALVYE